MDKPFKQLPPYRPGELLKAKRLSNTNQAINRFISGTGPPQQRFGRGRTQPLRIGRFKIKDVRQNHLVCREWDGSSEGKLDIKIAKPFLLRAELTTRVIGGTEFTYTFTGSEAQEKVADDGSDTETQVVVPRYEFGDEIYAVKGPNRGTGVAITVSGVSTDVDWMDMNIDARAWAKQSV